MSKKRDIDNFAALVKGEVNSTLQNLVENRQDLTDKMRVDIFMKIFEIVEGTFQKLNAQPSNELVNCISQVLYGMLRVNGKELESEFFSEVIDPLNLPEGERPFVFAFLAEETKAN